MKELTYAEAINEALDEEMARDDKVILMGEDVGLYGGVWRTSVGLQQKYGIKRVIDTPISENSFVGCAIGAAITGLRPIVEIMYIDFITLALDQIINQAAKLRYMFGGKVKVPIVIKTTAGAGKGNAAHHSQSLESLFCHIPGLKVVMPSTPSDAKGLLKSAIKEDNPVIFIEHKLLYPKKEILTEEVIPLGKAKIVRGGTDITLVATSNMLYKAMDAADILKKDFNISCEIIDPRTLSPIDFEMIIGSVKKTNNALIVHESNKKAGIGTYIASIVTENAFDWLDSPVNVIGGLDCPIPYSYVLEDAVIPSQDKIINKVKEILEKG
ncbi:MAG: alpha-ketoacid dehydrogenase subunit beta [Actinomycetota bacterium]|nr:alpha-ketoacid dehydrogenase subunit beta [Actinomycetota bacterium]